MSRDSVDKASSHHLHVNRLAVAPAGWTAIGVCGIPIKARHVRAIILRAFFSTVTGLTAISIRGESILTGD
jgi:hypothetical protein